MYTKIKKTGFAQTPNLKLQNLVSGFTLIETLVAISILSLSILAGFTAVQNGLQSSITAKNQTIAFYLVQEAMEYMKNRRDTNALDFINGGPSTWLTGISACASPSFCYIDVPANTIQSCGADRNTCQNLIIAGVTTNFKRAVTYEVVNVDEVNVKIWISWTQGVTTKSFEVNQSLFNRLQ